MRDLSSWDTRKAIIWKVMILRTESFEEISDHNRHKILGKLI